METKREQFEIDPTGAEWLEMLRYGEIEGIETYVDMDTGHVIQIGNCACHSSREDLLDDAKDTLRSLIDGDPDRYVHIPDLCPDPLPGFIESEWTTDADLLAETCDVYWQNERRYAGFKNNAPDDAVFAFREYQQQCREESLEAFYVELAEKAAARRARKEQVRNRLKAEAEAEAEAAEDKAAGKKVGREWAEDCATPKQLRRLAKARDRNHGWYIGVAVGLGTWAEHIYGIIEPDAEDADVTALLGGHFKNEQNNPDFMQGFAEAACAVWAESGLE
jgi:hypothetical protein